MEPETSEVIGPAASPPRLDARFERLIARARAALLFEAIWPPLAFTLATGLVFVAVSWFGLWISAPQLLRIGGVAAFAIALLYAVSPLLRLRLPTRAAALSRLDRDALLRHRPASSQDDTLLDAQATQETQALWALHRRRLAGQVAQLRAKAASPGLSWLDGRALRFGALLLAVAAAFIAGPQRYGRLAAAFDWRGAPLAAAGLRIDAWLDPPAYTNRPPVLLNAMAADAQRQFSVPADSVLVFKSDAADVAARVEGALAPQEKVKDAKSEKGERRWTLKGDGKLIVTQAGAPLASFDIASLANAKPTIELSEPPRANARGSMTLKYRVTDQYGLASAAADVNLAAQDVASRPRHSLVEAPKIDLQLPANANGAGEGQTTVDLSSHGWAGARVTLSLKAVDLAGEEGVSAPQEIILPQRRFYNPLARALAEQRRDLVVDPDANRERIAAVLAALQIAPDVFATPANVYLGLRQASGLLAAARRDPELVEVADLLWAMALQIEEGDASQAERDLRAAENALRDALKRGASDEELKKLTQDLRAAAQRFAQSLADKSEASNEDPKATEMDLNAMLDRMEESARNGARDQAQAMLDQLQDLLENMKSARNGPEDPAAKQARKQMGELDKLMRDQQSLRDDTFRSDEQDRKRRLSPDPNAQSDPKSSPEDGAGNPSLDKRQQALRERLQELQRALKGAGQPAPKGFDDAEQAMGEAESDLKGESPGKPGPSGKSGAVGAQGRALQALREGMQGLQQQAQGENGRQDGVTAKGRQGRNGNGRDPLGRGPAGNRGLSEGQLHEGVSAGERARRVTEELRRRLADPQRPQDERDYLDRLLKRE